MLGNDKEDDDDEGRRVKGRERREEPETIVEEGSGRVGVKKMVSKRERERGGCE